jgi:hypothetical protein
MQSFYEYLRNRKEEEEEEEKEEEVEEVEEKAKEERKVKEAEQEKKKEKEEAFNSPSPQTQQVDRQAEILKQHILEARLRFINAYPQLASKIDQIYQVAIGLLSSDYQSGKLRYNDFFDYLKEATELYAKTIESEHQFFTKTPIRFKEEKEVEMRGKMSKRDYQKYYIEEFLPSITKEKNFVEYIAYPEGQPVPIRIRGQEKYNTLLDMNFVQMPPEKK